MSDDFLLSKLPNFGYQVYLGSKDSAKELDEVIDLFLQPMFSANFRRSKNATKEQTEMKMGSWTAGHRLRDSIRSQITKRRAGDLPARVPAEKELDYYVDTFKKYGMSEAFLIPVVVSSAFCRHELISDLNEQRGR